MLLVSATSSLHLFLDIKKNMHVCILAATRRGLLFVQKAHALLPEAKFTVFSFKEDDHEPPFLESIRSFVYSVEGQFIEARQVGLPKYADLWTSLENIDVMFCVSWRYMIPPRIYDIPTRGTFVFHDSILPKYRGFAPTVWSIINDEKQCGVSLMKIGEEVDSGDIIDQLVVEINDTEAIASVMENVTRAYLKILEKNLPNIIAGTYHAVPQDHTQATFTAKRTEQDYAIIWTQPARCCFNLVRACTRPYPGAFTQVSGEKYIIWSADLSDKRQFESHSPGRVVGISVINGVKGLSILCGDKRVLFVTKMSRVSDDVLLEGDSLSEFKLSTSFQ